MSFRPRKKSRCTEFRYALPPPKLLGPRPLLGSSRVVTMVLTGTCSTLNPDSHGQSAKSRSSPSNKRRNKMTNTEAIETINSLTALAEDFTRVTNSLRALTVRNEVRDFYGWLTTQDRKSTRLNSSHVAISYAVFCLKK